jgi:hypothetical protein
VTTEKDRSLMRVFLVTAHPLQNSSHAVLHRTILESLRDAGHDIDVCAISMRKTSIRCSMPARVNAILMWL